jgi:thymidylate synthase (FAD)
MKAELIDHMGSDLSVVNAARVSFDKVSDWELVSTEEIRDGKLYFTTHHLALPESDADLITYLAKHDHWSPFAHTAISLRMQAPVPIRTQCFKHKQGLVENEESRRYISGRPQLFVPDEFRSKPEGSIKQGSGAVHDQSGVWNIRYEAACQDSIDLYNEMIADGVCPEQCRFVLPQGCEVQWIWTGNLYAFANFYLKRTDTHAQKEIQDLARMVGEIIEPLFPISWKSLVS